MRQSGFTLMEVLVAMVLVALLTLGLSQAVGVVGKGWQALGRAKAGDPAVVGAFLRRQIAGAVPLAPDAGGMAGSVDRLEFVGGAPTAAMPGGLYRHRLEIRRDELWYVWSPNEGDRGAERRLLGGVTRFELAYAARAGDWQPTWSDPGRLPRQVRMRLVVGDDVWPELVAAPLVDWPVLDRPSAN